MHLLCRQCNNILTTDLYPVKQFAHAYHCDDYYGIIIDKDPDYTIEYYMESGTIMLRNRCMWTNRRYYSVCYADCVGVRFTQFRAGAGCCDNSGTPVRCVACEARIGEEYSDCMDDKCVRIFTDKVDRSYKT